MRYLSILSLVLLSGATVLAQSPKTQAKPLASPVPNPAEPPPSSSTPVETPNDSPEKIHLSVGGGLAIYNGSVAKAYNYDLGKVGLTADFGFGWRVADSVPLYLGVETGLYYWGVKATYSTGLVHNVDALAVPFLPTVTYQFEMWRRVHPYIAVSAGPTLYIESETRTDTSTTPDTTTSTSKTRVVFEGLVHPGLNINLGKRFGLNIDPKLGVLDGTFILLSSVGALFRF